MIPSMAMTECKKSPMTSSDVSTKSSNPKKKRSWRFRLHELTANVALLSQR